MMDWDWWLSMSLAVGVVGGMTWAAVVWWLDREIED